MADNLLPARPDEAKQILESAIDDADQAIAEARDAVHGLRLSTTVTNDLAAAVAALGEELAAHHTTDTAGQNSPAFHVKVGGQPRDLQPILRDEIYLIAREAIRNAFRHAKARRIEAEVDYRNKVLRLRIWDDGRGIDPGIFEEGRIGHCGLLGMYERAEQIGGQLEVWTRKGAGTEVEFKIPGSIAYGTAPARARWWLRLLAWGKTGRPALAKGRDALRLLIASECRPSSIRARPKYRYASALRGLLSKMNRMCGFFSMPNISPLPIGNSVLPPGGASHGSTSGP